MKTHMHQGLVAALAMAMIGTVGPGAAPAQADPQFSDFIGRIVDGARHRRDDRRPYRRHYRDLEDLLDDRDPDDRRVREYNPYEREVRGLYVPGYDIRGVLDYNYSGHRH